MKYNAKLLFDFSKFSTLKQLMFTCNFMHFIWIVFPFVQLLLLWFAYFFTFSSLFLFAMLSVD